MKLCAGQIKYLTAIKELKDSGEKVRCVTISRHLGVSRPSVSKMLRCLVESGYVCDNFCSSVELTEIGQRVIDEMFENYNEIYVFFRKILRLSNEEAREQSLLFIKTFPSQTGERLAEAVKKSINKQQKKQ